MGTVGAAVVVVVVDVVGGIFNSEYAVATATDE